MAGKEIGEQNIQKLNEGMARLFEDEGTEFPDISWMIEEDVEDLMEYIIDKVNVIRKEREILPALPRPKGLPRLKSISDIFSPEEKQKLGEGLAEMARARRIPFKTKPEDFKPLGGNRFSGRLSARRINANDYPPTDLE